MNLQNLYKIKLNLNVLKNIKINFKSIILKENIFKGFNIC